MLSPSPILDGELLRAFVAFADEKNFTRAARRCALSQPALHERVQKLSDQLGVALYRRDGRALELTEDGARVAEFARRTLDRSGEFLASLRGSVAQDRVTLAAGEGAYLYVLSRSIEAFVRRSGVTLELLTLGGPACVAAVLEGRAHVGVAVLDVVPRGLRATELVRAPVCAVMSRRHPLAAKARVSLADLSGERLVLAPDGQSHRSIVTRAISSAGRASSREPPIEADGWPLMLAFAAMGVGVAIANGVCALPKGAVSRPIPELGSVTYKLVTTTTPSPATERLASALLERAASDEAHPQSQRGRTTKKTRRRGSL
jgi:DNA-binding transcriptional LysR family regulator